MSDLHDRAARALGWSADDVRSVSMQSLRDLVRPVDPNLAQEISLAIQSGAYITPSSAGAIAKLRTYKNDVAKTAKAYNAAARKLALLQAVQRPSNPSKHREKLAEAQRQYLTTAGTYNDARAALTEYQRTGR